MATISRYDRLMLRLGCQWLVATLLWPAKRVLRDLGLITAAKRLLGARHKPTVPPAPRASARKRRAVDATGLGKPPTCHIRLIGGWGYGNLGDEAILAGYLLDARSRHIVVDVLTVDPRSTRVCLDEILNEDEFTRVVDESFAAMLGSRGGPLVVAGGGYLNGSWYTEVSGKLRRIRLLRGEDSLVTHAIELRALESEPLRSSGTRAFRSATMSVRDESSAEQARLLGNDDVFVVPDAISLLYPHIAGAVDSSISVDRALLVNLLDIPSRSDSHEAEFDLRDWVSQCKELVSSTDFPIVGLAMDTEDRDFMANALGIRVVLPANVVELLSVLATSSGLVSTRMHPALLSSMLLKPTQVLPYCGKVRPTLDRLSLESLVCAPNDLNLQALLQGTADFASEWQANYDATSSWLCSAVAGAFAR